MIDGWEIALDKVRKYTALDEGMLRLAVSISKEPLPQYQWTRIGEGFGVRLAEKLLAEVEGDRILDPFAGSGTTLLASARTKRSALGIELMPMCNVRFEHLRSWPSLDLELMARQADLMRTMKIFEDRIPEDVPAGAMDFGLSGDDLASAMSARSFLFSLPSMPERTLLQTVLLMALQDRRRSFGCAARERRGGGMVLKLDKVPRFLSLESAFALRLTKTLIQLVELEERNGWDDLEGQEMVQGSAMDVLQTLTRASFDGVLTSPPYFNGFDYGHEYALEHWFLGLEEDLERAKGMFLPTGGGTAVSSRIQLDRTLPVWAKAGLDLGELLPEEIVPEAEREAFASYLLTLSNVLAQLARVTRKGGTVTFVIDDAYVGDVIVDMDVALDIIAAGHGLELQKVYRYGREDGAPAPRLRLERQRTAIIKWKKG